MTSANELKPRPAHRRSPNRLAVFYRTTVGKKVLMAISGLVLFIFVVTHLVGNLQIFLGAEKLDDMPPCCGACPNCFGWPASV